MKKLIYLFFTLILISCGKSKDYSNCNTEICNYLMDKSFYVHEINGFYIVASNEVPTKEYGFSPNSLDIFNKAIKLFGSFLDQNNDGNIDQKYIELSNGLSKNLAFVIGHRGFVDEVTENIETRYGIYGIGFFSDNWPYIPTYDGTGYLIDELNSSLWRPKYFDATWEETFHTITEAYNRIDNDFKFSEGAYLRKLMDDDILDGTYDISEQNDLENGDYDKITAVNEYLHQIWEINFSGQSDILNVHQKKALEFMIKKEVPMNVKPNYKFILGKRLK